MSLMANLHRSRFGDGSEFRSERWNARGQGTQPLSWARRAWNSDAEAALGEDNLAGR